MTDDGSAAADERRDSPSERPVDLRRQRLRQIPEPESQPELPLKPETDLAAARSEIFEDNDPSDPYGVGATNLTIAPPDERQIARAREARLALLTADAPGAAAEAAEWGWRGRINMLFGAQLLPRPNGPETAFRQAVERIRQPLPGTPMIVVANPKGGSGVTPTAIMLSALLGRYRGGNVVAWDAHESTGTLAARAAAEHGPATVWDVLGQARKLCSTNADASALARFLHRQPSLDEVLASDQDPGGSAMIGRDECAAVLAVLRRHRSVIVVDTGNNPRAAGFRWAIEHATALVVPVTDRRDVIVGALRLLDGVADTGHDELATSAVVVAARDPLPGRSVEALSAAGVRRVATVPWDPALASGERIVLSRLPTATVRAWTHAAADVTDAASENLTCHSTPLESEYIPETDWVTASPVPGPATQSRLTAYRWRHRADGVRSGPPRYYEEPSW
ncbi:MinD/ParA family ATP-binding protein [Nocardia aurantia]|uniref:MinD-like ATPase involved in chromosome partitioning or flagellar assembly n=1 Tax=Nocardia aurantia TaxID=2585199 RepID=A0A7K0DT15_9NOCA|nr:ParA family protein [Nocardia aurantia]MQY28913.1 hypothetical protein [Nocardia aurantia]